MEDPSIAPVPGVAAQSNSSITRSTPGSVVDGHRVISAASSARSWIRISLLRGAPARIGPDLVLGHDLRWIGGFLGSGSGQRCGGEWPIPGYIATWPVALTWPVRPPTTLSSQHIPCHLPKKRHPWSGRERQAGTRVAAFSACALA
jgi:hypothetical protein